MLSHIRMAEVSLTLVNLKVQKMTNIITGSHILGSTRSFRFTAIINPLSDRFKCISEYLFQVKSMLEFCKHNILSLHYAHKQYEHHAIQNIGDM